MGALELYHSRLSDIGCFKTVVTFRWEMQSIRAGCLLWDTLSILRCFLHDTLQMISLPARRSHTMRELHVVLRMN